MFSASLSAFLYKSQRCRELVPHVFFAKEDQSAVIRTLDSIAVALLKTDHCIDILSKWLSQPHALVETYALHNEVIDFVIILQQSPAVLTKVLTLGPPDLQLVPDGHIAQLIRIVIKFNDILSKALHLADKTASHRRVPLKKYTSQARSIIHDLQLLRQDVGFLDQLVPLAKYI